MLISLPQYSYLSKEPFDDIHMRTVLIWVNNPNDLDTIDNMVYDLKQVIDPSSSVKASYIDRQGQEDVMRVIDIIFYVTIGIMMFLCFFSLVASKRPISVNAPILKNVLRGRETRVAWGQRRARRSGCISEPKVAQFSFGERPYLQDYWKISRNSSGSGAAGYRT